VLAWTHASLIAVPAVMLLVLLAASPETILGGYANRDFTLSERLLTQGRVLLDYLSQML
jgi:hypothetical protein